MGDFDYIVVGGGVSGLGAFSEIIERRGGRVALLEGRDSLMYSLTWMKYFPFGLNDNGPRYTGVDFRKKILFDVEKFEENGVEILTGVRVFKIERENRILYARRSDGVRLKFGYKNLVIAVGGTQIVYGKYLLPGTRGGRIFSVYQVGEMLEHYPFKPGRELIVYGESEYSLELALEAHEKGLSVFVVSPGSKLKSKMEAIPGKWPEDVPVYTGCNLKQLLGDVLFKGIVLQQGTSEFCVGGDSFAVDGEFVLEHPWREHLGVEWNLDNWEIDLSMEGMKAMGMLFVGDARKPSPNFVLQYQGARRAVQEYMEV